jgi:hypothetical protein
VSDTTNPIRLELLGEMIRRLQADVRTVRDESKSLRKLVLESIDLANDRMANHEARMDSRFDQMSEVLFAIADKLGVEYRR